MNKNNLYGLCVSKWGQAAQIDMCIEEMAELIKALCKAKRHKKPDDWLHSIYEEIADVTIMLEQMIIIFDGEVIIPQIKAKKLERLQKMLNEER